MSGHVLTYIPICSCMLIIVSNSLALCTRHRALLHNAILMGVMETLRAEFAGTISVVDLCLYFGDKFPHFLTFLKHFGTILTPLGTIVTICFPSLAKEPILDDFREKGVTSRLPTPPPPAPLFDTVSALGANESETL